MNAARTFAYFCSDICSKAAPAGSRFAHGDTVHEMENPPLLRRASE
jgi:hypothetical protein